MLVRWMMLGAVIALLLAGSHLAAQGPPEGAPQSPIVEGPAAQAAEPETEEDEIETDRDSFTPSPRTPGRNRLIVESAYTIIDNRTGLETHSLPELILRYGLTERIELRLGWNAEVGGEGSDVTGAEAGEFFEAPGVEREYTLAYGVKLGVTRQDAGVPESAVIVQAFTPTGGESTATDLVATYIFGWVLPNRWKADAAIRYGTGGESGDRFTIMAPSAVVKVPVGEGWNIHAEYFGLFSRDRSEDFVRHYFSPGIHYLITPDLEIGVRVGWGLNDQTARFFTNVGLGWRF